MSTNLPLYRCQTCNRVYCSCVDRFTGAGGVVAAGGSFANLTQGSTTPRMTSPRNDKFSLPMLIPKQMHRQQHSQNVATTTNRVAAWQQQNQQAAGPLVPAPPVELPPISARQRPS